VTELVEDEGVPFETARQARRAEGALHPLPHGERDADRTPALGWAGWDALQRANALGAYFMEMKDVEGWPPARLALLLAGLVELLPWLQQWHNEIDPETAARMGDFYRDVTGEEARALGCTLAQLRDWRPTAAPARGRPRRQRR
jgi:hypothetical protein